MVLTGIAASNDDVITGNNDMGGQDVLPVPNVYNGWVQNLPQAFKDQLTLVQKSNLNPIRMRMNRIDRLA